MVGPGCAITEISNQNEKWKVEAHPIKHAVGQGQPVGQGLPGGDFGSTVFYLVRQVSSKRLYLSLTLRLRIRRN